MDAPFNLDFYCHTGPIARTVADTKLLQNVLCGPHPDDPMTLPCHEIVTTGGVRGCRIAISRTLGFFEVDPEVEAALLKAAQTFHDLGAVVEEIELPWGSEVMEAALTHLRMIFGTSIAPEAPEDWERMTPYARQFAKAGLRVKPQDYLAALTCTGRMSQELARAMTEFDLLICPTTAVPALHADFDPGTDDLIINGRSVDPMLGWVMTFPFNMLSSRPAISVPCGQAEKGVPIGLQIIGHPFDDDMVFSAALDFEKACTVWSDMRRNFVDAEAKRGNARI